MFFMRIKILPFLFFVRLFTFCSLVSFLCFLFAQNLFVKKIKMFEIVLIGSINITTESKLLLKKCVALNKLKTPFKEFPWLTERHAMLLVTVFYYHHVIYRTPCHASGHLLIYHECYGFESAFFTLKCFLPYTPSC